MYVHTLNLHEIYSLFVSQSSNYIIYILFYSYMYTGKLYTHKSIYVYIFTYSQWSMCTHKCMYNTFMCVHNNSSILKFYIFVKRKKFKKSCKRKKKKGNSYMHTNIYMYMYIFTHIYIYFNWIVVKYANYSFTEILEKRKKASRRRNLFIYLCVCVYLQTCCL